MVRVSGHRGAAGLLPENTLKGFEYAIGLGCDFVECDVHLTWDGFPVVMHDEWVDRTTNGTGRICRMSFEAIRRLDAGEGEQVPTLDEVLETVQGRVQLLCELKGEGVEKAAVEAVRRRGMESEVFFTSFDLDRLEQVRLMGDHLLLCAILPDPSEEEISRASDLHASAIDVHYRTLCLAQVDRILEAGMDVRAWNPDTLREQKAMIGLGVTDVSTNRPDILIEYLRKTSG